MSDASVTRDGETGVSPGRDARTWSSGERTREGAAAGSSRCLVLRTADHQGAHLGRARHRRIPVHGRSRRRLLAARAGRRSHRPSEDGARVRALRGGVDRRLARRAGARPGAPRTVSQHAARVQADLADERRGVDPRRLRAARGGRGRRGRARARAAHRARRTCRRGGDGRRRRHLHGRARLEHGGPDVARGAARAARPVRRLRRVGRERARAARGAALGERAGETPRGARGCRRAACGATHGGVGRHRQGDAAGGEGRFAPPRGQAA